MERVIWVSEKEAKSEELAALHSRHRKISSANSSALARFASYVYDKAENKCTD